MDVSHVRPFYKFWLEIEDEEGTREQIVGALSSVSSHCLVLYTFGHTTDYLLGTVPS